TTVPISYFRSTKPNPLADSPDIACGCQELGPCMREECQEVYWESLRYPRARPVAFDHAPILDFIQRQLDELYENLESVWEDYEDVGERYHDTPLSSRWTVGIPLRVKNRLAIEFMDSLPIDASYENFFEAVRRIEQLAKDAADQISDDEDTLDSISVDIALRWARDATSGLASLHRKVQWLATSVTALENAMTNPGLPAETVLGRQERTRYRRAWSHHFSIFEETRTDRSLITE
ncbi:hypothetical protein LTR04_003046, partial [Oleoguttula sp. CCFEE 6159]